MILDDLMKKGLSRYVINHIDIAVRIAQDFVGAMIYSVQKDGTRDEHQDIRKAGNTAVRRGWRVRISVKCTFSVIVKSPHVILLVENLRFIY